MAKQTRVVDVRVTSNVGDSMQKGTTQAKGLSGALKSVSGAASVATGGIRAMAAALMSSGIGAVVVAIGALVGGISGLINKSRDFDKAFSNLAAVTGKSKDEIAALKENAKQLGATTAFTATQVLELSTEFAKLGFSTTEILNASKATLDLAAAAEVDLAEAASVAGSTLRGFGLESQETQRVVDVMAKSFTSSALDMEKFKESMKLVAPIAKTTKVSIEESAAALSILADRGVSGSMAGTQLRRIMSDLAQKTGKDFATSLEITADRLSKATSTADKLAIAKELVGDRAKGSLIALAENREELQKLKVAYDDAGGAAEEMAEKKLDNLDGSLTKLSSAWDGFMLNLEDGQGVIGKLAKGAVDVLTHAVTSLTNQTTGLGFAWDALMNWFDSVPARMKVIGLDFEEFGLKARILAEDIPFWGNGEDKARLEGQLAAVRESQAQALADLKTFQDKGDELMGKSYLAFKGIKLNEVQTEQETVNAKAKIQDEFIEGQTAKEDDAAKKLAEDRRKFREKLKKMEEDSDDIDAISKLERKKERHLAEMEELKLQGDEAGQLRAEIEAYWDDEIAKKKGEISQANYDAEQKRLKDNADAELKLKQQLAEQDEKLRQEKMQGMMDVLDTAARVAGEESDIGKALLAIKTALQLKELALKIQTAVQGSIAHAQAAQTEGAIDAAKAGTAIAVGQANSAKVGFPWNIVTIAGYALQAAMLVKTMTQSKSKLDKITSASGAGGSVGGASSAPAVQAPSFNVLGATSAGDNLIASTVAQTNSQPVKAYVVESEVSSAQSLGRHAENMASVG